MSSDKILQVSQWATVVFVVVAVAATAWLKLEVVAVLLDVILFAVGCLVFLAAYLRGLGRSRDEEVSMAGLFFLVDGTAPAPVARLLRLVLAIQVVVAVVTASIRPFTGLAFGVLVPMFGLAMLALWGALHGTFPVRSRS